MQIYVFKKVDHRAPRQGKNGTGVRLPYSCGFCKERFRSRQERTDHTKNCKEPVVINTGRH